MLGVISTQPVMHENCRGELVGPLDQALGFAILGLHQDYHGRLIPGLLKVIGPSDPALNNRALAALAQMGQTGEDGLTERLLDFIVIDPSEADSDREYDIRPLLCEILKAWGRSFTETVVRRFKARLVTRLPVSGTPAAGLRLEPGDIIKASGCQYDVVGSNSRAKFPLGWRPSPVSRFRAVSLRLPSAEILIDGADSATETLPFVARGQNFDLERRRPGHQGDFRMSRA